MSLSTGSIHNMLFFLTSLQTHGIESEARGNAFGYSCGGMSCKIYKSRLPCLDTRRANLEQQARNIEFRLRTAVQRSMSHLACTRTLLYNLVIIQTAFSVAGVHLVREASAVVDMHSAAKGEKCNKRCRAKVHTRERSKIVVSDKVRLNE